MAKINSRTLGLWALVLAGAPLLGSGCVLAGEVSGAAGALGLGTAVNGVVGGSCGAGLCQVSGGTAAGSNLFHRFSAFDTRGAITGVNVNTGGIPNVFMAVLNPAGTFIDKSVNFSGPTNLVWLSPGGISVSGAGGFANVQQLNLSTATGWKVGGGVFEAAGTTAGQAALLSGTPVQGLAGAVNDPAALTALGLQKNGDLTLAGGLLTVEKELLLDAQGGNVLLQAVGIESLAGSIEVSGASGIRLNQGATLNTTTGKIALTAADGGVEIQQATISSSSGPIELSGIRSASLPGGSGLTIDNSIISSGSGAIDLRGTGGGVASITEGIDIFGGSQVFTENGNISLLGIGGDTAQAANFATANGIDIFGSSTISTETGEINLFGRGGEFPESLDSAIALGIGVASSEVSSITGSIVLDGAGGNAVATAASGNAYVSGIGIYQGVVSTGTGSIELIGEGGEASAAGVDAAADADGIKLLFTELFSEVDINLNAVGGAARSGDSATAKGIFLLDSSVASNVDTIVLNGVGGSAVSTGVSGFSTASGIEFFQGVVSNVLGALDVSGRGGDASVIGRDASAARAEAVGIQLFPETRLSIGGAINLVGGGGIAEASDFATARGLDAFGGDVRSGSGSIVLDGAGGRAIANVALAGGIVLSDTTIVSETANVDKSITFIGEAGFEETAGLSLKSTAVSTGGLRITGELAPVFIEASGGSVVFGGEIDITTSVEFPSVSSLTLTDALFSGSGLVTLPTAGTTTVSGAVSARALAITGGEVAGTGTLTLTGPDSFWSGGSITEATVRVANGATFTLNGGTKYFGDASLNIEAGGMVNWTSGDIQTYSNYGYENSFRSVTNAGTFDIQGDLNWTRQDYSAGPDYSVPFTITSTGTLLKSAGTGTSGLGGGVQISGNTYRGAVDLTNNGLVDVQSGTLRLFATQNVPYSSGTFNAANPDTVIDFYAGRIGLTNGANLTGSGTNLVSGAYLYINGSTASASNLQLNAIDTGAYPGFGWGAIVGSGTLSITGSKSAWSRGPITGITVLVEDGATFTFNGGDKYFGDANINIAADGTVNWTSGDIQTYSNYGGDNANRSVVNAGTFDIQGDLNWTRPDFYYSGNYTVPFTITSTGTLLKSAGTGTAKLGDTVQVAGSTYRSAIDLTNNGLVDVQSGTLQLLSSFLSGGNVAATHSAGEFRASSPTSVIEFYAGTPGLVDGARLTGSGTNLLSGALLHINGTTPTASNLVFTGVANTVYPASVGVLLGGGTLTITGADSQWQGGSLSNATLRVAHDARLTLNGSTKYFGDSILAIDADGAVNWTSGDIQTFSNSYSYDNRAVDNAGVFSIQGDLAWTRYSQSATGGDYAVPFLNTGIIEKTAGTGTASLGGSVVISGTTVRSTVDLTNKGLVDVQSGTLELVSSSSYTNDGTIKIDGSATLRIPTTFTHADTGLLDGSGTLDLAGNTFTNLGTISPGGNGTVGTLSINGNVDLKDGTLAVDLGGSGAGQSDLLAVTGNVGIAGILDADVLPGFTPVNGEAVSIITGTRLGATTFATTDLPAGFIAGYDLAAGEAARLIYSPSSPTGNSWVFTNAAGGLDWATANNWSGGVLPGVLDTAVLSSGFAVQHSTGDNTIFGLTINNANSLAISGGSLTVTGTTNLDGALTVAGGTANLSGLLQGSSGAVTVQGGSLTLNGASEIGSFELSAGMASIGSSASISAYTQTGGSLTGSGSVTVTQDFQRTDGSFGSALTGVSLTQASGNLTPGELSVNGPVTLTTLSGNLSINDLLTASDRVTLQASGDINLGSGASISSAASGDAIIVAAGGNFSNFAGSNALSAVSGRRLIYSSDPALDNRGGLSYDFKHYSQAYSGRAYAGPGQGNGFLYSTSPTITPGLTGTITKSYDGTVDAVLTAANFTTSGAIDNDVIALYPLIGTYNSKDVVQANSVWVDGLSIASSTNYTGNVPVYGYQLSLNSVSGSGSITAKSLSISGSSAQGRSYDGTTNASINLGTLTGLIGSEQLNVSASGSFESKNAGARTATANYTLGDGSGGGLAANYTLAPSTGLAATITPANLTISATSDSKTYDGSTSSSLTPTISGGTLFSGDSLSGLSQSFNAKDVLAASKLNVNSGYSLVDGNGGLNYNVSLLSASGSITPRALSTSGTSAQGRSYDGTTNASINLGTLTGLISGEQLNVSASGSFESKNAGMRTATATYALTDGSGLAANYTLAPSTDLAATITKANLTISATSDSKTYDDSTASSATPTISSGTLFSGDSLTGLSQSFNAKDVLSASTLTVNSGYTLNDGNGGLNYSVSLLSASGSITRRPVSTWSGQSSGLWSDPANWDALPSAANVAAVLIPAGTAAVSYDGAAGSTQLQSLTNNQSLSLDAGSLAVGGTTSVGPGATLSLNGGGFTTAALSNAGLVNGSGALLLEGFYSESASGRLGSGFSRVEITQTSGPLSLRGVGASGPVTLTSFDGPLLLNGAISSGGAPITLLANGPLSLSPGASLTSAGGTLSLFGFGPLNVEGASLNASGAAPGGTVQLNGPSIALSGTSVNTSGTADGGTIRIGSIELAGSSSLPTVLPSTVSIRNSSLVADPPALGGSINVNGAAISVSGSSFNVVGSSGGTITIGSAATASLSLDALTSLLGGGGASFGFFGSDIANSASTSGGVLSLNGQQQQSSKPPAPAVEVVIPQQTFNPLQSVQNETNAVGAAPVSPLGSQPVAPAGEELVSIKLTDSFSFIDSTDTTDPQDGGNAAANPAATSPGNQTAALAAQPAQQLSNQQVAAHYTAGEQKTAETTATKLGLTPSGGSGTGFKVPTPAEIQAGLRQVIDAIRQQFSP